MKINPKKSIKAISDGINVQQKIKYITPFPVCPR